MEITNLQSYGYSSLGKNPLNDLISDEIFHLLNSKGLFNETGIRDRVLRMKFRTLREKKVKTNDAIEMLMIEYPYLQFETIKKIVHHPPKERNS